MAVLCLELQFNLTDEHDVRVFMIDHSEAGERGGLLEGGGRDSRASAMERQRRLGVPNLERWLWSSYLSETGTESRAKREDG